MQRGEIWTLRDSGYASKARPAIIIQDESVALFDSIILCLLTTHESSDIKSRVAIEPSSDSGLNATSFAMTDKIVTVDKSLLGYRIGRLSDEELSTLSQALRSVLGL